MGRRAEGHRTVACREPGLGEAGVGLGVHAGFEGLDGMAVAREEALQAQRVRRPAAADQRDGGVAVGDEAGPAQDERPHHHIRDVLR